MKKQKNELVDVSTATLAARMGINPHQIKINNTKLPHQLQSKNLNAVLEVPITLEIKKSILNNICKIEEKVLKTGQVRFDHKTTTISLILGKTKEEYLALILESEEFQPGTLISGEMSDFALDTLLN